MRTSKLSTNPFTLPVLQAINDWQRGGDEKQARKRGAKLKAACICLPAEYRECHLVCFRQKALVTGEVWDLLGEGRLAERISSWSTDLSVAKNFKGGVPPELQGLRAVIFNLHPRRRRLWST
jgi:hypothetical protein